MQEILNLKNEVDRINRYVTLIKREQVKEEVFSKVDEINTKVEKLKNLKEQLEEQLKKTEDLYEITKNEKEQIEKFLRKSNKKNESLQKELSDTQKKITLLKEEKNLLEQKIEKLEISLKNIEKKLQEIKALYEAVKNEKEELENLLKKSNKNNELLKKQLNEVQKKLETKKEELEKKINSLKKELQNSFNENKNLQQKFSNLDKKYQLISSILSIKNINNSLDKFKNIFYNDFLEFANKEDSLANEAEMLLKLQEIEKELELISAYPKLYSKNNVAIGGGFSAGKSEFISSFIKSSLKLPIGVIPTTAIPTYVFNEEKDVLLGCSKNGGVVDLEKIDKDFYKTLSHEFIKSFEFNLKDIMPYMIIATKLEYENICFIDTPGYNPADVNEGFTSEDIKTAKEFLEEANCFIWLIGADANGTIQSNDLKFLKSLDLKNKKLFIVFNKADIRAKSDLEDVLEVIEEILEDEGIEFEGISAYSSVSQEEYLFIKKSLKEFLKEANTISSKQEKIYEKLKYIYSSYKKAIKKQKEQKEEIFKELHSLSFDILENGDINEKADERISKLKTFFSTKKEEENLKKLKEIFEKFKESVDEIFGNKIEFSFEYKKLYPIKKDGLYGVANEEGEWIIEPILDFDNIYDFENGVARVRKNSKYGLINDKGEIILELNFDKIYSFKNGIAKIKKNEKYGLINNKGKIILLPEADKIMIKDKFIEIRNDNNITQIKGEELWKI